MRSAIRVLAVAALATFGVGLAAVPGGAGAIATNTVTVDKEVDGPVPAGTTFTVEVSCSSILGPIKTAAPTEITFDATGTPTSNNVVNVPAGMECTATETVDGGAETVGYACDITRGNTDQTPPFLGNCTGTEGNQVTFTDVIGDAATITVTNTFPEPSPVQPVTPVAQAVQAAPVFTG